MIVAKTLTVAHRIQKALEVAAVTRSTDVRMLNEVGSKGTCSEMHMEVHCSFVCKELQSTQLNSNSNTNPGTVGPIGIGIGDWGLGLVLLSEVEVEVAWTMNPWTAGTKPKIV